MDIVSYLLGKNAGGGGGSPTPIATEISETSTNEEAAGAKAVYDYAQPILTAGSGITIEDNVIASTGGIDVTYSTTDLTPGVSPLAEGALYFVYE